jgi:hypothetical protein
VSRLLGVVAEQTAKRCHGLIYGVLVDIDSRPDLTEQVIDADDLTSMFGEAQQKPHRPHLDPRGLSIT